EFRAKVDAINADKKRMPEELWGTVLARIEGGMTAAAVLRDMWISSGALHDRRQDPEWDALYQAALEKSKAARPKKERAPAKSKARPAHERKLRVWECDGGEALDFIASDVVGFLRDAERLTRSRENYAARQAAKGKVASDRAAERSRAAEVRRA